MKHNCYNNNVHILRCVIFPKPFVECSPPSFIYTCVHVSKWEWGKPLKIKLLCPRLFVVFINMICDGKDAIHMCTKFDVYVFYY